MVRAAEPLDRARAEFWRGLRPVEPLSVAEWADSYRKLPGTAGAPGQWRTAKTPYLREPMEELSASSPTQVVVLMFGAQLGKTETGLNWVGHTIDHDPCTHLVVWPTKDVASRNSKLRVEPMIESTPVLRDRVLPQRSRDSGNTILQKEFPGGQVIMVGANSPTGLKSTPARKVLIDELDEIPEDVGAQGSVVALAKARCRTYGHRWKMLLTSTPTVDGASQIANEYDKSDQRQFYVPCPECDHFQTLKFRDGKRRCLIWEDDHPETAAYACEGCGTLIPEWRKTEMLARGEWRAKFPDRKVRGYHLNSLYSPIGMYSWGQIAEDFMLAKDDRDDLKTFVNTVLAEVWTESGEAPDWEILYNRREAYQQGTVPAGALVLTAGVDIQRDRIELEVVGWGRNRESWSIDYVVIPGDTFAQETWDKLAAYLDVKYPHELGPELSIRTMAVDSGDGEKTHTVYSWARGFPGDRVLAIKGSPTPSAPLVGIPTYKDVSKGGKKIARGVQLWSVGVSLGKSELYGWLRHKEPTKPEETGYPSGYCHFPADRSDEWFRQLTSERHVPVKVRGGRATKFEWQLPSGRRNEALDCRVYARAAAYVVGIDRWTEETWRELRDELLASTRPKPEEPEPKQRGRLGRFERKSGLGRFRK